MIKFNIKTLFNKSKPEETSVTLTAELEKPETPKEIFDKAVASVVKANLSSSVLDALFILVYGQEAYDQTVDFILRLETEKNCDLIIALPKAIRRHRGYNQGMHPTISVDMRDLLNYLTEEAYTQVYGETK
jgi:hypothetical protein